jgi:hypothetical protein
MDETVKRLEARIVELEQKLAAVPTRPQATQITAEEVQAFHKVKDLIATDWGEFCGINDCFRLCVRCQGGGGTASFRCITRCINECVCGPCSVCAGGGFGSGGGTFGGFGG